MHKTLKGLVDYHGPVGAGSQAAPCADRQPAQEHHRPRHAELAPPSCLSVFVDHSGVIDSMDHRAICIKVETHNQPSAIEPYGGAGTGIGGVIRDTMGTGLGAKPICQHGRFLLRPAGYAAKIAAAACCIRGG